LTRVEYESSSCGIYSSSLHNHDVPCVICHVTKRASQMIGHASTMDTWWREDTIFIVQCIHMWMKLLITREEHTLIAMVLCSISSKDSVAHFPASLISQDVSWHAQYALVKHELIFVFSNYWTPIIVTFIYSFAPLYKLLQIITLIFWHSGSL
jgi:hypothetical protein